ncbi:hypothetical protein [uncultured Gilvimarinus sp.]|uniref:hypothetical protein n=1 Tax=uncultured Gilvimarinus sp. TaxID=1689143 RepID=UPI0030D7240A
MSILIGLSATQDEQKIAAHLSHELNLRCANFKQPIINMVATLVGCEQQQVEAAQHNTRVTALDCDFATLSEMLTETLTHIKHDALQNFLQQQLKSQAHAAFLFNGVLVRGITTSTEAQWVRDQGGIMVHVRHQPAPPKPHKDDIVIAHWRNEKTQYQYITDALRAHQNQSAA